MEDSEYTETIVNLYARSIKILLDLPKKDRHEIDELDVVFVDNLNGRLVSNRVGEFLDVIQALADKGKPVGLIFNYWGESSKMRVQAFADISIEEEQVLMSAFAEAQDEAKEMDSEEE